MGSLLDAVAWVLEDQGQPQSCFWLVSLMEETKLYRVKGTDPEKTVRSRLRANIRRYGERSRFLELPDGRFALQ
jgi:hypothetical protein